MTTEPLPQSEFLLSQTEDGRTRIQCRFENETIWLTQAQIADLFQTTPQNVTLHLKAIFAEGELEEAATCKDYLQVRTEGSREVTRNLRHYRLEAIIALGYRVRGRRGIVHVGTCRAPGARRRTRHLARRAARLARREPGGVHARVALDLRAGPRGGDRALDHSLVAPQRHVHGFAAGLL
jgi:hypothetical protein